MKQFNYKCVVTKNGNKMYYKRVSGKWNRITNKVGQKAEKGKKKYRASIFDVQSCQSSENFINNNNINSVFLTHADKKDLIPKSPININNIDNHIKTIIPHISFKQSNNFITLNYIGLISRGGYGRVYEYSGLDNNNNKYSVVIKIYGEEKVVNNNRVFEFKKDYIEKDFITNNVWDNQLKNCQNDIIRGKNLAIGKIKKSRQGIAFPYMDGTLFHLKSKVPNINKIFWLLTLALICFKNNGYAYTDLKEANILYKCEKYDLNNYKLEIQNLINNIKDMKNINGNLRQTFQTHYENILNTSTQFNTLKYKYSIKFGDVGSFVNISSGKTGIATYPLYNSNPVEITSNLFEVSMIWSLCVMYSQFLFNRQLHLLVANNNVNKPNKFKEFYATIRDKYNKINILNSNEQRLKEELKTIINKFCNLSEQQLKNELKKIYPTGRRLIYMMDKIDVANILNIDPNQITNLVEEKNELWQSYPKQSSLINNMNTQQLKNALIKLYPNQSLLVNNMNSQQLKNELLKIYPDESLIIDKLSKQQLMNIVLDYNESTIKTLNELQLKNELMKVPNSNLLTINALNKQQAYNKLLKLITNRSNNLSNHELKGEILWKIYTTNEYFIDTMNQQEALEMLLNRYQINVNNRNYIGNIKIDTMNRQQLVNKLSEISQEHMFKISYIENKNNPCYILLGFVSYYFNNNYEPIPANNINNTNLTLENFRNKLMEMLI